VLTLLHPALVAVALATAGPRAYEGPVGVAERPKAAPTVDGWPASAGPPPGSRAAATEPAEPVPGDMASGPGDAGAGGPSLPGAAAPGIDREVRYIEVTSNMLGRSSRLDVQRHAGGRSIVDTRKAIEQGASSVTEMLDKVPGVRAVEGNSGLSTTSTKLNVAVRGANPRLSEQATVLLDEVPIAPAPYGNPSLSLFPLSLFQIAKIDAVRGGSSVRFGPWTSGGVFNLVSHPIPENPTISVTGQVDQFGDAGVAGSYGGTHRKLGMYFEYAPRFGKTYRDNSDFSSQGGIIKFAYPFTKRLDLESSTHLFWEQARLPGGLRTDDYEVDRYQSLRPNDRFDGHREATNLKLRWRPKEQHELQVIGFYSHTFRRSVMATNEDRNLAMEPTLLTVQPRRFDVFGIEPRYVLRVNHKKMFQDLAFGVRGVFEWAKLRETWSLDANQPAKYLGDASGCERGLGVVYEKLGRRCLDGRTAGFSLYAEDKLYMLDSRLVLTAGVRGEIMQQGFYDLLNRRSVPRPLQGGVLPGVSLWYGSDEVAGFIGYGRSFGAPSYFSATINMPTSADSRWIQPELADTWRSGSS
jgi:Fe(3+) dicitrate transport protein